MRYIVGLLLGIGLIVLTFILIFRAFSGDDTPQAPAVSLPDYATSNAVMRYTIDGPVVSQQEHNRIRVTVSKDTVLLEQIQGYEGTLVQSKTYPTNTQAYGTFLRALDLAGFDDGNKEIDDDERGYCPNGRRYIYEAIDGSDSVLRWWATSCSADQGSFLGNDGTIRRLFQNQVPYYNELTRNIRMSSS
jgi:hypothetical protein